MRLPKNKASYQSQALVGKILNKIEGITKPQKKFIISMIILFLSMRGRYTFKGMERYGSYCEKSYRLRFEQSFNFFEFNLQLCQSYCSKERIIVFDPSFLPKSGKHTPHRGYFWSGCQGRAVKGIEIGGLAIVDIQRNTALNLEAIQTPSPDELATQNQSLIDHYSNLIINRAKVLKTLADHLVVDGYFAKKTFVDLIADQTDLQVISKLRMDANLKYFYNGPRRKGRGRPKKYAGKVHLKKIDKRRFKWAYQDEDVAIYQASLWSVSLKRTINVAYVQFLKDGQVTNRYAVYFSTDLNLNAEKMYRYYKARFQIEFLFRDAKQFTGLTHCQARSENKIYFHTNASLTAVSIAKVAHYWNKQQKEMNSFSIADIKTSYFNELMLNLFLSNFEIDTNLTKNKKAIKRIMDFGKIAA